MFITLKMSLPILQQICAPLENAAVWLAIISALQDPSCKLKCLSFCYFSLCSILYFFAKGASKLGHVKLWARLWWKLIALRFSWKAAVLIFISIQNQIAQK